MGAVSRFNIQVTEADIERAHVSDSYRCVVAQAIARMIPDATNVDVDTQSIRFTRDGARLVYLTPYAVQGYVIAFDAGERIEPFSFQLRNPARVTRRTRTATGKRAVRAYNHAARSGDDDDRTESSSTSVKGGRRPPLKPANANARTAYAAVAAKAKEPLTRGDGAGRKAPPRVFKTKQRSYGHRLLRINRIEVDEET